MFPASLSPHPPRGQRGAPIGSATAVLWMPPAVRAPRVLRGARAACCRRVLLSRRTEVFNSVITEFRDGSIRWATGSTWSFVIIIALRVLWGKPYPPLNLLLEFYKCPWCST